MSLTRHTVLTLAAAALFVSAGVHADATVVSLKGDVRADGIPVKPGEHVIPRSILSTGSGAQAHLQFPDRQEIVLDQDTRFRIAEFHYVESEPQGDRATFDLLRGAMRFVSGAIGERNPAVVALRTPNATFSVRGTDFMVVLSNRTYLKVQRGAVGVTNLGGTVVFGANTAATVTSVSTIAQPVFAANLPPDASGPFSSLAAAPTGLPMPEVAAVSVSAASGTAGAATGAARAPLFDVRAAINIGIGAALVGAALSGTSATTHH